MAIVEYRGWEMIVSQKIEDDPEARAEIIEALKKIVHVLDVEKAYKLTRGNQNEHSA